MELENGIDTALNTPLDPDDFTFFGFGQLTRDERRKISRLTIRSGPPGLTLVENAVLDSGGDAAAERPRRLTGGIFDSTGAPVDAASVMRKGGKQFGRTDSLSGVGLASIAEDVIYLGPLFNHFGRVLLETLARAWFLNDPRSASQRVVVSVANSAQDELAPWLPPLLEAFAIPPHRLYPTSQVTQFRQITVPEPLFEQSYSAHRRMVEPFHRVAENLGAGFVVSDQPLYLSRNALSSRQRPIIGEAEIERIFSANGARIVYPETLPLAEQVRLFNTHRDVFSPVGSAAHSVLFATNRPRLHLLASRDDIPANFFLCSALSRAATTFVNCLISAGQSGDDVELETVPERRGLTGRGKDPNSGLQSRPQKVEIEPFMEYLKSQGFTRHSYRPLAKSDREMIDARFDEAWAYARLRKAAGKSSPLSRDAEEMARRVSSTSWPVSLMMARYYSRLQDAPRARVMVIQFLEQIAVEQDERRLRHFQADVASLVQRLTRLVDPDVGLRLQAAIETYLPALSPSDELAP